MTYSLFLEMLRAAKQTLAPKKNTGLKGFIVFPLKTEVKFIPPLDRAGFLGSGTCWCSNSNPELFPCSYISLKVGPKEAVSSTEQCLG